MSVYWYISDDKLETITGQDRWLDRLDAKISVGLPIVNAQLGMRSKPEPSLISLVGEGRRRIAKEGAPSDLAHAVTGRPPSLFSFEGPATRLIESDVLWIAGMDRGTAFLLAGSSANAIGTPIEGSPTLSPTADPIGTIRQIFEAREVPTECGLPASYIWRTVVEGSADAGGLDASPWISGIAVYSGRLPDTYGERGGAVLVIGSPLFVEQV